MLFLKGPHQRSFYDADSVCEQLIPGESFYYKFRADYSGTQTWSDPLLVTPDVNNPVDIAVGGSASSFLHDPSSPLRGEDRVGGEGIQVASLYMLPGLLAQLSNSAFADSNGEHLYFYHSDHLGTPLFLTDISGTVVWKGEYLPFGGIFTEDKDPDGDGVKVAQPFRFPGQYADSETGLYYNYFRDYDPTLGRYVEADPVGLAGGVYLWGYVDIVGKPSIQINLYLYTSADPINIIDPLGLQGIWSYGNDSPLSGFYSQVRAYDRVARKGLETAGKVSRHSLPIVAGLAVTYATGNPRLGRRTWYLSDLLIGIYSGGSGSDPWLGIEWYNPDEAQGRQENAPDTCHVN